MSHDAYCETYIVLDDLNFGWKPAHVTWFREMWIKGVGLTDIAKQLHRPYLDVALLVIDQDRKGLIRPREKGRRGSDGEASGD